MPAWRSRPAARLAAAAVVTAFVANTKPTKASEFVLTWDAPDECPASEVVRRTILTQLGAKRRGMTLKASATVTRTATAFRVQLHTYRDGQRGVRELEAPTCEALVEAISVIVALAVDPVSSRPAESNPSGADARSDGDAQNDGNGAEQNRAPGGASPTRQDDPATRNANRDLAAASALASPRSDIAPQAGSADAREPLDAGARRGDTGPPIDDSAGEPARTFTELGLQGVASLAGSVESGVLPGLGFGITARGGARFRRFRVEAAISRWFARQSLSAGGRGAEVDGMSLAGWGCFRAVPGHTAPVPRLRASLPPDDAPAIEAGPCLGAEIGGLDAESRGVSDPGEGSGGYVAVGGALRLGATAADWLSLDVRFEALRVLHRPEFQVENVGVVYEPRAWSIRAALGAETYFP